MEITAETKINDLLNEYPFLLDYLIEQSSHFKNLRNPIMQKTMGKVATVKMAASVGGLEVDELLEGIKQRVAAEPIIKAVEDRGHSALETDQAGPLTEEAKQEALKGIIRDLHDGVDMEILKSRFREIVQGVEAQEIARLEQQLMDEGLPAEEIKNLCDVHVELFKEALEAQDKPDPTPGHPVHTFMKENRASEEIISSLSLVLGLLGSPPTQENFRAQRDELNDLLDRLSQINIHYTRKENQLFPMLEAHHFTGPSQVMWAIHDEIRVDLKRAQEAFRVGDTDVLIEAVGSATRAIREMIYKEEHILYPTSLDMLTDSEWLKVKEGEQEIGYAWVAPDQGWPGEAEIKPGQATEEVAVADTLENMTGVLRLDTGGLTLEQVKLILNHLPFDLTFVDASDRVAYYSEGDRIFPRSPAIIGREVRNCHPPKSLHKVNRILDEFKAGRRNTAEFWIELGGKFIYIRYFAVRDEEGRYFGCLEVSQDMTKIRKLEGEQRLLDWE